MPEVILSFPHDREHPYTVVSNQVINDERLSPEERVLFIYLLSKPKDWQMRMSDVARYLHCGEGKASKVVAEIIKHGYMQRSQEHRNGRWCWECRLIENPQITIPCETTPRNTMPRKTRDCFSRDIISTDLQSTDSSINGVPFIEDEKPQVFHDADFSESLEPSLVRQENGTAERETEPPPSKPAPTLSPVALVRRRGRPPKVKGPQEEKVRDARLSHPTLILLRSVLEGRWPPKPLWDTIIAIFPEPPKRELLIKCRAEWILRGYNPNSLKWLTEWAAKGGPESRGNGQPHAEVIGNRIRVDAPAGERIVIR